MARIKQENIPDVENQELDAAEEKVVKEIPTPKQEAAPKVEKVKKTFTDSDYILCRSVCFGGLNITCQSGNSYEFRDYDAECEINYRDLVSLIRKGSDHVFLPRFIILDEDLLEDFPQVKRAYEKMYTTQDLIEIMNLPRSRMKAEIAKLPTATKNVMCKMIATEIASGRLDSISKVRDLSEIFNSDFNLLSQLFVK